MANKKHVEQLRKGISTWNDWKIDNLNTRPDLSRANLNGTNLNEANLSEADLSEANLSKATLQNTNLSKADLNKANLKQTILSKADLKWANLKEADLSEANLSETKLWGINLNKANLSKANLRGANLNGADLSGANLNEADLSGADLSETNLWETNLNGVNFSEANLNRADLSKADLKEANLSGANLSMATLIETILIETNLSKFNLRGTNFKGANLSKANLKEADLNGANLSKTNLNEANLSGLDLSEFNLIGADLRQANLNGANLSGANLWGVNLSKTNLSGFNLNEVDFSGANLSEADMSGADLRKVNFEEANLNGTNLSGTNLSGFNLNKFNFSKANLSGANLSRTNLNKSNFTGANLSGVDLRGTNLIDAMLDGATLTGAQLWETQRGGWSIKGVICDHVYWDRESKESVRYTPHEFEKLYSEKTKIILHYAGGINPLEIATLPALIQKLGNENKDCSFNLESIKDDAGGATVTIITEGADQNEITILNNQAHQIQSIQRQLDHETNLREIFQHQLDKTIQLLELALESEEIKTPLIPEETKISWEKLEPEEKERHEKLESIIEKVLESKHYCSICKKSEKEVENLISKSGISICEDCLINMLNDKEITTRIQRSLVFKPEHKQAGISILNYFSEIVKQKYPYINVKMKIEQEKSSVRMIIETPEGEIKKKIEETLTKYGMVVQGQIPPNQLLSDPLEIMALKYKLELSASELRYTKDLLDVTKTHGKENKEKISKLEDQVELLHKLIGEGLKGTKSAHLLIKKLLDKYNSNDIVKDSLKLIEKKISVGIKSSDEKEIKQILESIKKEDPKALEELSNFTENSIAGAAGNLLYSWIIAVTQTYS